MSQAARVVVGLDFGTTFSGFAFAHRSTPEDVHLVFDWPDAPSSVYCKTRTSLLYSTDAAAGKQSRLAWGWSALRKHGSPASPPKGTVIFTNFKLRLSELHHAQKEADDEMPVEDLISDYLRCISDFIVRHLVEKYGSSLSRREIQWCLTVPAIWTEMAKQKMQLCAEKAELVRGKESSSPNASCYPLKIILEPEAASFHCQEQAKGALEVGDQFIVADVGGGTIDLVVHSKKEAYQVHEVSASSGQIGGGNFVDDNFLAFLKRRIGCFEDVCKEYPGTLDRVLEWWLGPRGKSSFNGGCSKTLEVPRKLADAWMEHDRNKLGSVEDEDYYDELSISEQEMKAIFDSEVEKVVTLIASKLSSSIKCIFLVGGFSENAYLVKSVKCRFKEQQVIVPLNPGAAVCKGAVSMGFGSGVILSRVSKNWYGIEVTHKYRSGDPPGYRFLDAEGVERCLHKFASFLCKGATISEDSSITHTFSVYRNQKVLPVTLLCSSSAVPPRFTTDPDCEKMDSYSLDTSEDVQSKDRKVKLCMYFGRSSVQVSAQRINFGQNRRPEKLYACIFA